MSNEGTLVLEEGTVLQLDFGKLAMIAHHGMKVVPAVVQQHDTYGICHTRTEDGFTRPGCFYRVLTGSSALAPWGRSEEAEMGD